MRPRFARQTAHNRCAIAFACFNLNSAIVQINEALSDGKAQANAA